MPAILSLLVLIGLAAPLRAQAFGTVRGYVRSEDTGEPLVSAMVEVSDPERVRTATTDRGGRYVLREVPAGLRVVRASYLGHAVLEVEVLVPAGREVELDIALRVEPVQLEPVRVEAGGVRGARDTIAAPGAELGMAGARALTTSPGLAELGLVEAARGAPGQDPADPSDVLYIRGAGADLKLVYLDGAPVYAPFPLGGLLETFTPDLLRTADLFLGGAPARYDGGLSYILDLKTRGVRADTVHASGAVDLLSSRGLLEIPLGERAGVLAVARAVHGLGTVDPLPYGYGEGLLRADLQVTEAGAFSITGFRNREEVWMGASEMPDSMIRWGNSALSLRYRGRLAGEEAELTLALGKFDAALPLQASQPILAEGSSRRARVSADLGRRVGGLHLRYGASYDRMAQNYRARERGDSVERRSTWTAAVGEVVGAYTDVSLQAAPRLRLRGGLRANYFSLGRELVFAPRAAATWLVTERAALTLAAGRYHQYLRAPEGALLSPVVARDSARAVAPLAVGHASHFALSLDQDLGEGVRLGVEGFYKNFGNMPDPSVHGASASGVDVWARRSLGNWTGWLGYSLAWIWSQPAGAEGDRFSGRHLLTAGLAAPLGDRARVDVNFAYGAGLPYAAIHLASNGLSTLERNDPTALQRASSGTEAAPLLPMPDQPFLRLDLSAARDWTYQWAGREVDLSSYVKLLNTLSRRDALFYRFQRERDDRPRALGALPLVPVLGLEWRF